jgi:energy-coupling factor transport system substrate-specific component
MSTTERDGTPSAATSTASQDGAVSTLLHRRSAVVQAVLGLLAAAVVLVVGLPDDVTVFGATLADLTLPAALLLVMGGLWAAGWTASRRAPWRVVDIVTASVLGVAFGLVFVVWNLGWATLSNGLAFFPPLSAVAAGVWLLPAVVGGLVVRRPGAAVYTELVAATLSALIGNQWGFATVWYGLLEGLGAEVVLALLLYRRWGLPTALLAGAGAGVVVGLLDAFVYYPDFEPGYKAVYVALAVVSGVVVAGLGGWALTRALGRAGALAPLASARDARRV